MENRQKMYEIGYLLTPLIPEDQLDEAVVGIRKAVEDCQGLFMNEARPKMRILAYSIKTKSAPGKGFASAYFGWIKFMIDAAKADELKNALNLNDKLIRFLITATIKEGPQKKKSGAKKKKALAPGTGAPAEKTTIKPEEIDKKLDEIIGA